MLMNTIAVGPLEPFGTCVTGEATLALPRLAVHWERTRVDGVARLHASIAIVKGESMTEKLKCAITGQNL